MKTLYSYTKFNYLEVDDPTEIAIGIKKAI